MKQQLAKASFYLVAVGMFVFTAYMTIEFMGTVLPNAPLGVKLMTLLVFDGGMLSWLVVFTSYAQGTTQRATALFTCLFDFFGLGLMVAAEIMTSQSNVTTDLPVDVWATWAVAGWTVVNVGSVLVFHLSDPETRKEMRRQARLDSLTDMADRLLDDEMDRDAAWLATQLQARQKEELLSSMNLKAKAPDPMLSANIPTIDDTQPIPVIPARPEIVAAEAPGGAVNFPLTETTSRSQAG